MSSTRHVALVLATAGLLVPDAAAGDPEPAWTLGAGVPFPSRETLGRTPFATSFRVALVDLDGDGVAEIVTADRFAAAIAVTRYRDGAVGRPEITTVPDAGPDLQFLSFATGDLEPDGDPDLVALATDGRVVVFRNDGTGTFTPGPVAGTAGPELVQALVPTIVRRADGRAFLAIPAGDDGLVVRAIDDTDGVGPAMPVDPAPAERVVALDADEDGLEDLAVIGPGTPIRLWRQDEKGFAPAGTLGGAASFGDLDAVDLDGDGLDDLVATRFAPEGDPLFRIVHNREGGDFDPPRDALPWFTRAWSEASFGDLDGDGLVDAVVTSIAHQASFLPGGEPGAEWGDRRMHVFRGVAGPDRFEPGFVRHTMLGHGPTAIADVSGDRRPDLVQVHPVWDQPLGPGRGGGLTVMPGAAGRIPGEALGPGEDGIVGWTVLPPGGDSARSRLVTTTAAEIRLHRLDARGWLRAASKAPLDGVPLGVHLVRAGRLADGSIGVAASWEEPGVVAVQTFRVEDGTIRPGSIGRFELDVPAAAVVFAADFDGDARLDVGLWWDGRIRRLEETGVGGFEESDALVGDGAGIGPFGVSVADLDGDGWLDVIAEVTATNAPRVWFGRGDAGFEPVAPPFDGIAGATDLSSLVADWDGDGNPDVLSRPGPDGAYAWVAHAGQRRFELRTSPALDGASVSMGLFLPGDFDGDGDVDLLSVRGGDDLALRVLRNDGIGVRRFAVPDGWMLKWTDQFQLAAGDLDGDGRDDLVGDGWLVPPTIRFGGTTDPGCPADLDADGRVGFDDLQWWLASFGRAADPIPPVADLDADGAVGTGDLLHLVEAWGDCP